MTCRYNQHTAASSLRRCFDEAQFAHLLLPRKDVVYSWVHEGAGGIVTDFASFYSVPMPIIVAPTHSTPPRCTLLRRSPGLHYPGERYIFLSCQPFLFMGPGYCCREAHVMVGAITIDRG